MYMRMLKRMQHGWPRMVTHTLPTPLEVTLCSYLRRSHCAHASKGHTVLTPAEVTLSSYLRGSHRAHSLKGHTVLIPPGHTVLIPQKVTLCSHYLQWS
jgi:hypothetical protein